MKIKWTILLGLVVISSPFAQNLQLKSSKTTDEGANRRSVGEFMKSVEEYKTPVSGLGKLVSSVLSMVGVGTAVTIAITNNHAMTLTEPRWYIADGKLDTPPPDILLNKQTMIITIERHPNKIIGLQGSKGILTFKMGASYLLVLWSAVPVPYKTNRLLVKIVNQDPNPVVNISPAQFFDIYNNEAWDAGDYGKWHSGTNANINCKFITAMGNGDKAPLEVFLS